MTQSISNVSELSKSLTEVKVLSYSEEMEKVNKIKYAFSVMYFVALSVLMTTLYI